MAFVRWPKKRIAVKMANVWPPPRKRIAVKMVFAPWPKKRIAVRMVNAHLLCKKKVVAKEVNVPMGLLAKRAVAPNHNSIYDQKIRVTAAPVLGAAVLLCPIQPGDLASYRFNLCSLQ
jgi:hypothetical protein